MCKWYINIYYYIRLIIYISMTISTLLTLLILSAVFHKKSYISFWSLRNYSLLVLLTIVLCILFLKSLLSLVRVVKNLTVWVGKDLGLYLPDISNESVNLSKLYIIYLFIIILIFVWMVFGSDFIKSLYAAILGKSWYVYNAFISKPVTFPITLFALLLINTLMFIFFRVLYLLFMLYWAISYLIWGRSKLSDNYYTDLEPYTWFINKLVLTRHKKGFLSNLNLYFRVNIILRAYLISFNVFYHILQETLESNKSIKTKVKNFIKLILLLVLNLLFFYLLGFNRLVITSSLRHANVISNFWVIISPYPLSKGYRSPRKAFYKALNFNILPIILLPEFNKYKVLRIYKLKANNKIYFNPTIKKQDVQP